MITTTMKERKRRREGQGRTKEDRRRLLCSSSVAIATDVSWPPHTSVSSASCPSLSSPFLFCFPITNFFGWAPNFPLALLLYLVYFLLSVPWSLWFIGITTFFLVGSVSNFIPPFSFSLPSPLCCHDQITATILLIVTARSTYKL